MPLAAVRVTQGIRHHWEVENKAHWVLDVVFKEDDCRIRKGDGAENVGITRRFCLNLERLHPQKNSMWGKLKHAGVSHYQETRGDIHKKSSNRTSQESMSAINLLFFSLKPTSPDFSPFDAMIVQEFWRTD